MNNAHFHKLLHNVVHYGLSIFFILSTLLVGSAMLTKTRVAQAACSLQNPIVPQGQDPSIWYANGPTGYTSFDETTQQAC